MRRRHFGADVLAGFQGLRRQCALLAAAHGERHRVHVLVGEYVLVRRVDDYLFRPQERAARPLRQRRDTVTSCRNTIAGHLLQPPQPGLAAAAQSYHRRSDLFQLPGISFPRWTRGTVRSTVMASGTLPDQSTVDCGATARASVALNGRRERARVYLRRRCEQVHAACVGAFTASPPRTW